MTIVYTVRRNKGFIFIFPPKKKKIKEATKYFAFLKRKQKSEKKNTRRSFSNKLRATGKTLAKSEQNIKTTQRVNIIFRIGLNDNNF